MKKGRKEESVPKKEKIHQIGHKNRRKSPWKPEGKKKSVPKKVKIHQISHKNRRKSPWKPDRI